MKIDKGITDSSLARMAGNIASGMVPRLTVYDPEAIARRSLELALHIADEIEKYRINRASSGRPNAPGAPVPSGASAATSQNTSTVIPQEPRP